MIGRRAEQERSVVRITVKVQCFFLVGMICASMAASSASHQALCSIAQAAEPAAEIKVAHVKTPWKAGVSLFQEAIKGTEMSTISTARGAWCCAVHTPSWRTKQRAMQPCFQT